jgi:short-subunit dehydrogenase
LSEELRDKGIRVTAVCPGFTKTEFAQANGTQDLMDQAPRRLFQTAEAVAESAIEANRKGRVVFVPGLHNKLAATLLHYLPETLVTAIIRRGSAKYHLGD